MTDLRTRLRWARYFATNDTGDRCRRCAWYALTIRLPDGDPRSLRYACYDRCRQRKADPFDAADREPD